MVTGPSASGPAAALGAGAAEAQRTTFRTAEAAERIYIYIYIQHLRTAHRHAAAPRTQGVAGCRSDGSVRPFQGLAKVSSVVPGGFNLKRAGETRRLRLAE